MNLSYDFWNVPDSWYFTDLFGNKYCASTKINFEGIFSSENASDEAEVYECENPCLATTSKHKFMKIQNLIIKAVHFNQYCEKNNMLVEAKYNERFSKEVKRLSTAWQGFLQSLESGSTLETLNHYLEECIITYNIILDKFTKKS